jgi:hypothetical protein
MAWLRVAVAYLIGQLVFFAVVELIFRIGWLELIGPYLAFTASFATTMFGAWFLNTWGVKELNPRQFGLGAALWFAFFIVSINCAWFYLAFVLNIFSRAFFNDPSNYGVLLVFPVGLGFSVAAFRHGYRVQKARIESRAKVEDQAIPTC